MKFETFKAGKWQPRYQYKSFEPTPVNCVWTWEDPRINTLLEQATRALGELNAFSLIVPDIDRFIEMHVVKEAQSSSKIEGTQTGIDEVLMAQEHIRPEKRDDWREVRNYVNAVNMAIAQLPQLPLSNRLLKQTHAALMNVRMGNDLTHWVRFFLNGVAQTATKGKEVFQQILALRTQAEHAILDLGKRAALALQALQYLYRQPIVDARGLGMALNISVPTANKLVNTLIDKGILAEVTGQQRGRNYAFVRYLNLFTN